MSKDSAPHVGIYGRRNSGKSTIVNRLVGQEIAIVSEIAGTTTDPVKKSFEITGFGPVVLIDTAGIDDQGDLGQKRVTKTLASIKVVDLAILVITGNEIGDKELDLIRQFSEDDVPFIVVHNKEDVLPLTVVTGNRYKDLGAVGVIPFGFNLDPDTIIEAIKSSIPGLACKSLSLLHGLIKRHDIVLLVTPIDSGAPGGRLILPQVQTIRAIIDSDASCVVLKENEVDFFLRKTAIKPTLVITDSQAFSNVSNVIPEDIPLTSFSILLAHYKGNITKYLDGTPRISSLIDGDRVLIMESCSHHVSCDDIGRLKIPRWLSGFTGKQLLFDVVSGLDQIPLEIKEYALVVQCGGCMITRKQIANRLKPAIDAGIPVTNYGMAIAYTLGIYNRVIAPFIKQ